HGREEEPVSLHRPVQIRIVVGPLHRLRRRTSSEELESGTLRPGLPQGSLLGIWRTAAERHQDTYSALLPTSASSGQGEHCGETGRRNPRSEPVSEVGAEGVGFEPTVTLPSQWFQEL